MLFEQFGVGQGAGVRVVTQVARKLAAAEVLVFESQITAALGRPEANIDLDAISFDDRSRLYFSLQADLTGTSVGDVADGDVLRLDGPNQVSVVFTESVVQNQFTAATGLSDSIGDVQGLEWVGGEVWVVTQAPSSRVQASASGWLRAMKP